MSDATHTTAAAAGINPSGPAAAVLQALAEHPGSTVVDLASYARIGKSTASKVLTTVLEERGYARRTAGGRDGGRRMPDIWYPTSDDDETGQAGEQEPTTRPADDGPADDDTPASTPADEVPAEDEKEAAPGDADQACMPDDSSSGDSTSDPSAEPVGEPGRVWDPVLIEEARNELVELTALAVAAVDDLYNDPSEAFGKAEVIKRKASRAHSRLQKAAFGGQGDASRARRGGLRELVAAFLAEHPEGEFTPHQIGTELGRSSGAVANALDRLVALGHARRTSDKPRRYTHNT